LGEHERQRVNYRKEEERELREREREEVSTPLWKAREFTLEEEEEMLF